MIVAPPRASGQSSGGVSGDWKGAGSWGAWGSEWVKPERGGQIQVHFPSTSNVIVSSQSRVYLTYYFKGIYQLSAQWNGEAQKCEGLGLEPKAANSRAHVLLL